jgi:hypothetical protein
MSRFNVVTAFALVAVATSLSTAADTNSADAQPETATAAWPLQLEMRVPFEPTAFPSAGRIYLMYELHLTNFGAVPLSLRRVEVLDAASKIARPIATFEAGQLDTMLQPYGAGRLDAQRSAVANQDGRLIAAGGTGIVFMSIAFDRKIHIPNKFVHRVVMADSAAEGDEVGTHNTQLHVLGPPLEGANWLASDGPGNDEDNHHRRGIFIVDGNVVISRRYAIDWMKIKNGATFSGDARDRHSYYAYGKPVLAVADGRVITAKDGFPENVPGHNENFHAAMPITMQTVVGNTITLELGGGQFAYCCHLQRGSLRVKVGDHVRRGQILARVGVSGDAREPHLHFEVTTSPKLLAGEGVPYVIDKYQVIAGSGGVTGRRAQELPLNNMIVEFGGEHPK